MTVSLKHAFTSNVADSGDASLVQPSNWNAEHTLTAAANTLLGAVTAGAVTEITCTSAGRALLDDADAAAQRTTLSAAGTGVTNTFTANQIISVTDNTNAALRVTQLGTGNAILVEDSTNPDSTPFVVKATGYVGIGNTDPSEALEVTGNILSETSVSTGNSPFLSIVNTSGATLGSFGPSIAFDNSVANTHGFVVGQLQSSDSPFIISSSESPYTNYFKITQNGYVGVGTVSPACALDVTGGIQTSRTAVASPAATDGNIFSGTYTPTGTAGTNVTAVTTFSNTQYMRVGNTVTVSGYVTCTTTTASGTLSTISISPPIASNFAAARDAVGTAAFVSGTASRSTYAQAYASGSNIGFNFNCNFAGTNAFYFTVTYRII